MTALHRPLYKGLFHLGAQGGGCAGLPFFRNWCFLNRSVKKNCVMRPQGGARGTCPSRSLSTLLNRNNISIITLQDMAIIYAEIMKTVISRVSIYFKGGQNEIHLIKLSQK